MQLQAFGVFAGSARETKALAGNSLPTDPGFGPGGRRPFFLIEIQLSLYPQRSGKEVIC